jgi:hypothetical protein
MADPTVLTKAEDVDDHLLVLAANCVEDWFADEPGVPTEDFVDRYSTDYLNDEGWDIENYDCPAVRKIMRHARSA